MQINHILTHRIYDSFIQFDKFFMFNDPVANGTSYCLKFSWTTFFKLHKKKREKEHGRDKF